MDAMHVYQGDEDFEEAPALTKKQFNDALEEIVEECLQGEGPLDLESVVDKATSEDLAMLFLKLMNAHHDFEKLKEAREDAEDFLLNLAREHAQTQEEEVEARAYRNMEAA